jgi:recombination protein U
MNYPSNIKKSYNKNTNYGNRGMFLESLINQANELYLEKDIAVIYKKPTPIQVVKYDYATKRIKDAYYLSESTLDYNGIYNGYYIEFDAKSTNTKSLPLANIAKHQLIHLEKIINHKGIAFLIIMINNEAYLLPGKNVINFIKNGQKKSISYDYIKTYGYKLKIDYLKGIEYIPAVDLLIKEMCDEEN